MKVIGIVLMIFGLLTLAGGLIGAVGVRLIPDEACEKAAQDKADAARLRQEGKDSFEKEADAEVSASICSDHQDIRWITTAAGLVTAAIGLVITVAGFFVFRRGRRVAIQ